MGSEVRMKYKFVAEVPMFAFEVPTTYGVVRVVGPATMMQAEADTLAETMSRVLRILALDPDIPVGISVDETRKVVVDES
jgi:hypothetical protein